jgi:hypothetical protein
MPAFFVLRFEKAELYHTIARVIPGSDKVGPVSKN